MGSENGSDLPFFVIQWHITGLCDQACRHCYMVNDPVSYRRELEKELSLADCKTVIDSYISFCESAGARPVINFTGGDPLMRPDFFEILEYAHLKGIKLSVMGNPFHLTAENVSRMKKLGLASYQVSLDGMEKSHDFLRMPGSFSATVRGRAAAMAAVTSSIPPFALLVF